MGVTYPTAQLLAPLAKMSAAGEYVTEVAFLQLILDKANSAKSSLLEKTEFARVIRTIRDYHAARLSPVMADRITAALSKATGPGPSDSSVGPRSETSTLALVAVVGGTC